MCIKDVERLREVAHARYDIIMACQMGFAFVAAEDLVRGKVGVVDETHGASAAGGRMRQEDLSCG